MTGTPAGRLAQQPASAPAVAWPGGGMTYGELAARTESLALAAAGLGAPGTPLAIVSASRLNTLLGVLAALRLGRPALPLDPARPDLEACLAAAAPGGTLTDEMLATASAAVASGAAPPVSIPPGQPVLLVPTSGTSGVARVAMLSAAALDAHVAASAAMLPVLGATDRWLVCLPMTSIGALAALWRTLSTGACLGLLERFDADDARRFMAAGASHVSVVPAMLAPLAASAMPPPRGLRCMLSGGGPLSTQVASIAQAKDWPLWNGWGMTETCSHVAVCPVDENWREGVAGRPLPGAGIEIDRATGRLAIAGPMLMSGYADGGLAPGDGLEADGRFLSGDLGEILPDGRLRLAGRADDVIVTGGVNVHPQGIEDLLAACPGAGDVAVTARPDDRWGMTLVVLYTGDARAVELDAWARGRLPSATRPREFLRVDRLPRNAMGKLLRTRLPDLLRGP
jgi:O-succinylbenzoic acid--CoA ligase